MRPVPWAIPLLANIAAATYGLNSIRMIRTFSLDTAVSRMESNLAQFSLDPDGFFDYGGDLYHSIAYYCLALLEWFGWTVKTFLAGFVLPFLIILSTSVAQQMIVALTKRTGEAQWAGAALACYC